MSVLVFSIDNSAGLGLMPGLEKPTVNTHQTLPRIRIYSSNFLLFYEKFLRENI